MTKKKEVKKENNGNEKRSLTQICDISLIDLTGWNPRNEDSFRDEAFEELKTSMKENGFFKHEPLLVRPSTEPSRFQLIAGHRRLQVAKDLGFTEVPVSIQEITDPEAKLLLFIDNFHRKDFSPLEEAQGIKLILDDGAINQTELGKKMGKSQAYVANRLRLLEAPQELKDLIISQEITPSHANLLMPFAGYPIFKDIEKSVKNRLKAGNLSVKDLEKLIVNVINDYSNENVLNLDSFPYDIRSMKDFFDFENCFSCKDTVLIKNYSDGDNRRCLNQECWSIRLAAARKKFEIAEEKKVQDLLAKDLIDTSKMPYGTYEKLKNDHWDLIPCTSCGKSKKDQTDNLVCLDAKCFGKKEKAWYKEQNVLKDLESEKAWQICDDRLKDISIMDSRIILNSLVNHGYGEPEIAFSSWPGVSGEDEFDFSKISDEDLTRAVLRLVVSAELEYSEPNVESMEQVLKGLGV